ncbi:MAG: hypothetical protein L6R40_000001, partial [Gallowayella cf. fulva]
MSVPSQRDDDSSSTPNIIGKWYITYSTSPVWSDKRNVVLTCTPLFPVPHSTICPQLDDLITYQARTSPKVQTMRGTDTPSPSDTRAWTWRGNGLLKFVTSHWEILNYGEGPAEEGEGDGWMVVFAQKSMFTPAVLNICTRVNSCRGLKEVLSGSANKEIGKLTEELQAVIQ